MIEQERGRVDERPGEVLDAGEAFVGDLRFGLLGILPDLHEFRKTKDANSVTRLQERIASGEVRLKFDDHYGYA